MLHASPGLISVAMIQRRQFPPGNQQTSKWSCLLVIKPCLCRSIFLPHKSNGCLQLTLDLQSMISVKCQHIKMLGGKISVFLQLPSRFNSQPALKRSQLAKMPYDEQLPCNYESENGHWNQNVDNNIKQVKMNWQTIQNKGSFASNIQREIHYQ